MGMWFLSKTLKFYDLVKDSQEKLCIFAVAPRTGSVDGNQYAAVGRNERDDVAPRERKGHAQA